MELSVSKSTESNRESRSQQWCFDEFIFETLETKGAKGAKGLLYKDKYESKNVSNVRLFNSSLILWQF